MTHGGDDGDASERERAIEAALAEALASVHDRGAAPAPGTVDHRSLGIGIRLGLDRPGHARHLLELIGGGETDEGEAAAERATGDDQAPGGVPGDALPAVPGEGDVPAASMFLARSAAFSPEERGNLGPDVVFGWVTELSARQVTRIGGIVTAMLAEGARADIGRGFALAWDDGARIPRPERDTMFEAFTQLEVAVGSVLVGRDLRPDEAAPRQRGLGAFAQLFGSRSSTPSPAASAIEAAGEPGRRGLVALWNTWVAVRYRALIPEATFELLTRPWVTVVGRLPDR